MFGIDDMLSGLVGGATKALSNMVFGNQAEKAGEDQWNRQQILNEQQMAYNAQQAGSARQFAAEQQSSSQVYNANQAAENRAFVAGQQQRAENFNATQSQLNRDFQERMSSTAYQRSRADMAAAGLNPILAAGAGGASSPGGGQGSVGAVGGSAASSGAASGPSASASLAQAGAGNVRGLFDDVLTSAMEAAKLAPTIKSIKQGIATSAAEEGVKTAARDLTKATEAKTRQETETEVERTKNERDSQYRIGGFNPVAFLRLISGDRAFGSGGGSASDKIGTGSGADKVTPTNAKSLNQMMQGDDAQGFFGTNVVRHGSAGGYYYTAK